MNVTPALKKELAQWLDTYWTTYLKGDIETWATFIRDDYRNIGGTKEEIWHSKQEIIDYTGRILDQMMGTAEIRNREIEVIPYGEYMMVNEFTDLYVKIEGEWTFYAPFRMSSLLEKTNTGWIALHQHGSYPDMKALEGEAFSIDALKAENARLQEAVKSRTIELEIEAALERVRSKALAMHDSNDISETTSAAFEVLKKLGIHSIRSGVGLLTEGSHDAQVYAATQADDGRIKALSSKRSMLDHPALIFQYEEWKKQTDFEQVLSGDELKSYYNHQFFQLAKDRMQNASAGITEYGYYFPFKDGLFYSWSDKPYTKEEKNILQRFRSIIALTFRRYLDLKNAEAQAREAKIETALERTRTQSMLMQHSEQLDETLRVFHEQVLLLGIHSAFSFLWLPDEKNDRHIFWAAWAENLQAGHGDKNNARSYNSKAINYLLDRNEPATAQCMVDWKGNQPVVSYHVPPAGVESYFAAWQELIAGVEHLKPEYFSDGLYYVEAFMKYGCFGVMVESELSDDEKNLLNRFAIEFERTYTRFLDLQKAEAQSREAQIQLALERVRARTMAMQRSDELPETSFLLFQQVKELGETTVQNSIGIVNEESGFVELSTTVGGHHFPYTLNVPIDDPYVMIKAVAAWKAKRKSLKLEFAGQELKNYNEHRNSFFEKKINFPEDLWIVNIIFFSKGWLSFSCNKNISDETFDLLKRFATVFEQTYTRFNDLKQAEEQARESQIQLALERVRAKTMAMQSSEELAEVSYELNKQVVELGIPTRGCAFNIYNEHDSTEWFSNLEGTIPVYKTPRENIFLKYYEAGQRGETLWIEEFSGERIKEHYKYLSTLNVVGEKDHTIQENVQVIPEHQIDHVAYFKYGYLLFITLVPAPQAHEVFKRFAKEFEQTYARFLDLKKAESQTREAMIEAALERVRSRTMAMQHSDELLEVASIVFQQVKALGVPQYVCGVNIWNKGDTEFTYYPGTSDNKILPSPCKIPLMDHPVFRRFHESRMRGDDLFIYEKQGKEQTDHYQYMLSLPVLGDLLRSMVDAGLQFPTFQIDHLANFAYGNLLFITYEHCPELHDVFKRFAKVFEQTYTRFLDLQKAEAQALEAVKRASVDRVRAEIASMRTTADLDRITPLIWNELTTLGVPFIRCGVFIMEEEEQQVHTYLSNPEGEAIAAFHQPYNSSGEIAEVVKSWRKKEMFTQHWDEARFVEFTTDLVQQGAVTSGEKYLTENRPTDLYLHFLPFLQGMLYVGNTAPLSDDALQLVQNLADAFSTAYARYEDFNKLEAAKQQVDKTLNDLKQAQSQLVQAEKMASLGELTAGIAHEIQNPLNFVNNFSELSNELLDEMKAELLKGNSEEVNQLAADIQSNLEKINLHGKRADAIVKGMLQHSRTTSGEKQPTDINALADEFLRLAYHGLRAKDKSFNATLKTAFDPTVGKVPVISQDIGRVLLNLINNAFYAVTERSKQSGVVRLNDEVGQGYDPQVVMRTRKLSDRIEISVRDNGNGVPQKILDKIFQPFFTTKPTGQGTGLGLSLSYDIVKAHGGELRVETKEGVGSEFIISLSVN